MNTKTQYPGRVTMLDSIALDSEVFNILKQQAERVLEMLPFSVYKQHGTFGQQLLNVKYNEDDFTSNKAYVLCAEKLLVCYLTHHSTGSLFSESSDNFKNCIKRLEIIIRLFTLMNLLWFLREGMYPTLTDRLLGLRPVCIVNQSRQIGYKYMTRELLWHGFIELAGFTLSLVNYQYLRKKLWRLFLWHGKPIVQKKPLSYTHNTKCVICDNSPILPQHMGCEHVFCYYCIQSNRGVDHKFECPACGYYQEEILYVTV